MSSLNNISNYTIASTVQRYYNIWRRISLVIKFTDVYRCPSLKIVVTRGGNIPQCIMKYTEQNISLVKRKKNLSK